MIKKSRVTLNDIAIKAGVHKSTVCLALKDHFSIPVHTREKIKSIAREMQYRPDPALAALMAYNRSVKSTKYHATIAYVVKLPFSKGRPTPFLIGANRRCEELGFRLETFFLNESKMTPGRLSEILYHRNIRGVVIAPLPNSRGRIRMDWKLFSSVAVGYSLVWPQLHRVCNHQFRSMVTAVRQLRKMGYRRIGLAIRSLMDERVDHNWIAGHFVGIRHLKLTDPPELFVPPSIKEQELLRWYEINRPEVIVGIQSNMIKSLIRAGIRVPEDVGFVHIDCPSRDGTYAGIYQNWDIIGAVAIDVMVGLLHRNETGIPAHATTTLIDGEWIDGKSLLPKK